MSNGEFIGRFSNMSFFKSILEGLTQAFVSFYIQKVQIDIGSDHYRQKMSYVLLIFINIIIMDLIDFKIILLPLLSLFLEVNLLQYISMSLSVCALSGQPLKKPMASLKTGHLYEKQVIQKHLNSFPYCPITNQPMSLADLVEIAPLNTNLLRQEESPVSYFAKIQQEFNVLAVDAFKLRKSLKQTEEELTHSLYQNEAAQRVIAKLLKEKEDGENEIEKLTNRLNQLAN